MTERAVADTGPLVAIIRKREKAHKKCVAALKAFRPPLLTCWPVLTEAAWLLRGEPGGLKALGGLVQSGSVRLVELDESALHRIITVTTSRRGCSGVMLSLSSRSQLAQARRMDGSVVEADKRFCPVAHRQKVKADAVVLVLAPKDWDMQIALS